MFIEDFLELFNQNFILQNDKYDYMLCKNNYLLTYLKNITKKNNINIILLKLMK